MTLIPHLFISPVELRSMIDVSVIKHVIIIITVIIFGSPMATSPPSRHYCENNYISTVNSSRASGGGVVTL